MMGLLGNQVVSKNSGIQKENEATDWGLWGGAELLTLAHWDPEGA